MTLVQRDARRRGISFAASLATLLALAIAGDAAAAGVRAVFVGEQAGIRERTHTYSAHAGELNGDGLPDLLVVRHFRDHTARQQAFPRVYRNGSPEVGVFEDIQDTAFPDRSIPSRDRHDCPFGDVNADGLTDIYCTVGGRGGGTGPNPNELWLQSRPPVGGPSFRRPDKSQFRIGPAKDRYGRGRHADFINANGDEYPDLYLLNAYPRRDGRSGASRLFINVDGQSFRRAREFRADKVIGSDSLQIVDYNGDGRDDILVCGKKGVVLLRNQGWRRFRDVSRGARLRMGCTHALLADANPGDRPDLFRLSRETLTVHPQRRDGSFGRPIFRRAIRYGDQLAVGTMDADNLADAYVLRRGEQNADKPDVMLLNRRKGREFRKLRIPQLRRGSGDAVEAIDHDLNGLTDVVVMNGHRRALGPVELLAFYPK